MLCVQNCHLCIISFMFGYLNPAHSLIHCKVLYVSHCIFERSLLVLTFCLISWIPLFACAFYCCLFWIVFPVLNLACHMDYYCGLPLIKAVLGSSTRVSDQFVTGEHKSAILGRFVLQHKLHISKKRIRSIEWFRDDIKTQKSNSPVVGFL